MEGKTVQQLLTAGGREYAPLREHLAGVAPHLLSELQDLHDRSGSCMPSLFREIVVDGGRRISRMFGLSMRLPRLWATYRNVRGPWLPVVVDPSKSTSAKPTYSEVASVAAVAAEPAAPTAPVAVVVPAAPTALRTDDKFAPAKDSRFVSGSLGRVPSESVLAAEKAWQSLFGAD
jgi:hypothetical protein